jgi:hypothetical protein
VVETNYQIYVGIDWGSEAHQACALDHERRIVAERSGFPFKPLLILPPTPGGLQRPNSSPDLRVKGFFAAPQRNRSVIRRIGIKVTKPVGNVGLSN